VTQVSTPAKRRIQDKCTQVANERFLPGKGKRGHQLTRDERPET